VRGFLAVHDIGAFYRVLTENGWTQRQIAKATGSQQSQMPILIPGPEGFSVEVEAYRERR